MLIVFSFNNLQESSSPGKLKFTDEISAINNEAQKLSYQDVKIIIALGHSGFEVDKRIAEKCSNIDLVVGGHTNTFLYNGNATSKPEKDFVKGDYPFLVENSASGKQVPVVQAYWQGKYLGFLELHFDDDGYLIDSKGNPILLKQSMPQGMNYKTLLF